MIEQTLKSRTRSMKMEITDVVYKLSFKNAFYSFECYKDDCDKQDSDNFCFIEDFTDDEGLAEDFLYKMAKGKVFPIHIKDMVEDYFTV